MLRHAVPTSAAIQDEFLLLGFLYFSASQVLAFTPLNDHIVGLPNKGIAKTSKGWHKLQSHILDLAPLPLFSELSVRLVVRPLGGTQMRKSRHRGN